MGRTQEEQPASRLQACSYGAGLPRRQVKKAELEEYEWLKAAARSPAFDFLQAPEKDIYTLDDGKPFHESEWMKTAASELTFGSVIDPKKDI